MIGNRHRLWFKTLLALWAGYSGWLLYMTFAFVPWQMKYPYCGDLRFGGKQEVTVELNRPYEILWMSNLRTAVRRTRNHKGVYVTLVRASPLHGETMLADWVSHFVRDGLPERHRARFPKPDSDCKTVRWYAAKHMYDYGRRVPYQKRDP